MTEAEKIRARMAIADHIDGLCRYALPGVGYENGWALAKSIRTGNRNLVDQWVIEHPDTGSHMGKCLLELSSAVLDGEFGDIL